MRSIVTFDALYLIAKFTYKSLRIKNHLYWLFVASFPPLFSLCVLSEGMIISQSINQSISCVTLPSNITVSTLHSLQCSFCDSNYAYK